MEVLTQAMEMNLFIWTIYDHPTDYPESFIARRWEIGPGSHRPTDETLRAPELTALQDMMRERGLNWLPRHESDDPTIVESWI